MLRPSSRSGLDELDQHAGFRHQEDDAAHPKRRGRRSGTDGAEPVAFHDADRAIEIVHLIREMIEFSAALQKPENRRLLRRGLDKFDARARTGKELNAYLLNRVLGRGTFRGISPRD